MYSFESVQWAWDALWDGVHTCAVWTPPALAHSGDVHARWIDPDCVVNHVCGWPLARYHADRHLLVGTFSLTIPEAEGHRYRSTLLSPRPVPLAQLVSPDTRAVANSADSLSGWVSFLHATVGSTGTWPGTVTYTSAHIESLLALTRGDADLACLDSWTLALIERDQPGITTGLFRVGLGPLVPSPAVTVAHDVDGDQIDALRSALHDAIADPSLADAAAALRIDGFVDTEWSEYAATLDLIQASSR